MERDWIYFNSHSQLYRNPFGAVICNALIALQIKVEGEGIERVSLRAWQRSNYDNEILLELNEAGLYQAQLIAPDKPGPIWYYFLIIKDGNVFYYGNNDSLRGGEGQISLFPPPAYQITVYKPGNESPQWFREGIVYQIFVDRFSNCCENGQVINPKKGSLIHGTWDDTPFYIRDKHTDKVLRWNFFGGNLMGIIKKLPYLKELGISALYLSPIFEAPSNHKYDTADYKKIDPMFGDHETFRNLCIKAKEMGINIILDGVFSHTGSDSIYFNKNDNYPELGAYQSPQSPYYSWYRFQEYPHKYEAWWGVDSLPNVNELEPSYRQYMLTDSDSVIRYWTKLGAMGWRLDVADELPDEFIIELRLVLKETQPQAVLIGEVWEDASNKVSYGQLRQYFWGKSLDSVMNYPFRNTMVNFLLGHITGKEALKAMLSLYENYPPHNFYSNLNIIGSHDAPRILTVLGRAPSGHELTELEKESYRLTPEQQKQSKAALKLLSLLQMTFPGVPCIYYGDEAGMEGYADPYNRGPYPWGQADQDLLAWYKKITALRQENPVFTRGKWSPIYGGDDIFSFLRVLEEERTIAVAVFNRDPDNTASLELDLSPWCQGSLEDMLQKGNVFRLDKGILNVRVNPLEGRILRGELLLQTGFQVEPGGEYGWGLTVRKGSF